MPMWAWIAALAGGGLVIGGAVYVMSQQAPAPAAPAVAGGSPPLIPGQAPLPAGLPTASTPASGLVVDTANSTPGNTVYDADASTG